ncbi:MAG: tetratricopeptide repeat protein [Chloroflexi bacterium]|nr:tetratricopeptide repeat protein [Chloroflexota bacterium]
MATIGARGDNTNSAKDQKPGAASPAIDREARLKAALEASERFMKMGLYSAAFDECYEAIAVLPTYLPAHVRICDIHAARGRVDEAIEEYRVVASLCSARQDPAGAAAMYCRIAELHPGDATCRTSAERFMREQRWVAAIPLLEALAQMSPEDDAIYIRLAEAHFRLGDLAGSLRAFDRLAGLYLAKRRRNKALGVFRVMKEMAPGVPLPHLRLGDAYAEEGRTKEAVAEYEVVIDLLLKQGKSADAVSTLKRLVEIDPTNATARSRLAALDTTPIDEGSQR